MKKRSMVNLFVSALFTASLLVPSSVAAKDLEPIVAQPIKLQVKASRVYTGINIPESIGQYLLEQGVALSSDSLVEMQLCVKPNEDTISAVLFNSSTLHYQYDQLMEDFSSTLVVLSDELSVFVSSATTDSWYADFPPLDWPEDVPLSITATATREEVTVTMDGSYLCYRPQSVSGTCTYTEMPVYFTIQYACEGLPIDTEKGEWVYPDSTTEVYGITLSRSSPTNGRKYTTNDPYRSDRALYTLSGGISLGENITFRYKLPGEDIVEYSIRK